MGVRLKASQDHFLHVRFRQLREYPTVVHGPATSEMPLHTQSGSGL